MSPTAIPLFVQKLLKTPKLSAETERALLEKASTSHVARKRLLDANLRQVAFIALKYRRYGLSMEDLIGEGTCGLIRALEKFDLSRDVRFGTYARHWIRAFMVSYVVQQYSLVTGGSGALRSRLFFKLRRERAALEALRGSQNDIIPELAQRLQLSEKNVRNGLTRLDARDMSIETPINADGMSLLDSLASQLQDPESAAMHHQEQHSKLSRLPEAMKTLDERELLIIESRWLVDDDNLPSLADLGRDLGISRERARQLESRAKQKLLNSISDSAPAL